MSLASDSQVAVIADRTTYPRTLAARFAERLSVKDFGAKGDGVTDDTAAIQAAHDTGKPVYFPDGDYYIGGGVYVTGDLVAFGPGRILCPNTVTISGQGGISAAFTVRPAWGAQTTVSSITTGTYPATYGNTVSIITVADASQFSRHNICQIRSEDTISFAVTAPTKKGELFKILDVDTGTNKLYVAGILNDTGYTTTPVVQKLGATRCEIEGLTFSASGDIYDDTITQRYALLRIDGVVKPKLRNVTFDGGWAQGVALYSCWMPDLDVTARDLRDKLSINAYGYGVMVAGSSYGAMVKINAEKCRHAFTTNPGTGATGGYYYGIPRFGKVYGSLAINCTAASFDTHEAYDYRFDDCRSVHQSPGYDAEVVGQNWGFQNRGCRTRFRDCSVYGNSNGFIDSSGTFDYGTSDINTPVYDGILHEHVDPSGSLSGTGFSFTVTATNKPLFEFKNIETINVSSPFAFASNNTYFIKGARIRNASTFRMIGGSTVFLEDIHREFSGTFGAISSQEPFSIQTGCTVYAKNIHIQGAINLGGAVFRGRDGPGTVTLNIDERTISKAATSGGTALWGDDGTVTMAVRSLRAEGPDRPFEPDTLGTAAPVAGTWAQGAFVRNRTPSEAGAASSKYVVTGWICTVAGTPGTWLDCRSLTGN